MSNVCDLTQLYQRCLEIKVVDGCVQGVQLGLPDGSRHCVLQAAERFFGVTVTRLKQGPQPCDCVGCRFPIERREPCFLGLSRCRCVQCLLDGMDLSAQQGRELVEQRRDRIMSFADCFFQLLSRGLHVGDSNIPSNTLYRMRDALCQLLVSALERGRNLRGCIALLVDELPQQVAVQPPVPGNALQAICKIDPCDFGQDNFVSSFTGIVCGTRLPCLGRGFAHRIKVENRLSGSIGFDT